MTRRAANENARWLLTSDIFVMLMPMTAWLDFLPSIGLEAVLVLVKNAKSL